ncbi:MAG TPA: branched-chain amino acid transport system II carrier protein [Rhabdochlamydiaceae bacterium]|jgi:LIVCS family branched-chain amino acid:cation transporter|nr:branched-chain amino acid transport system II carrier protein [Rhabdochlamydiaceae bacterium]
MKKFGLVISTSFALFSMFFGSGNLVFPITVGKFSEGNYFLAALGILLTGVLVPFLGLFGMFLHQGSIPNFFRFLGKTGTFLFAFLALALLGPFGVVARCLTVAHGAIQLLIPSASLMITSIVLSVAIYLFTVNKFKIISVLGVWLTPILLLAIGVIAFFGLRGGIAESAASHGWEVFKNGFFQGYQTMDLLAAFFFSTFVIKQLKGDVKIFLKSSAIAAVILAAVYLALVVLGWAYAPLLGEVLPQEMLGRIAIAALGPFAAPCVCIAVLLACLTTAITLAILFSDFLRTEILRDKISYKSSLILTLVIGILVSTLEFSGIAKFLGPLLEMVYPALISLTLVNIGLSIRQKGGDSLKYG